MNKLHKVKSLWNRLIWGLSLCLFSMVTVIGAWRLNPILGSRTGKTFTWSIGKALSPFALPWWFWAGLGLIALYLWWKHKLIMSVVFGLMVSVILYV